MSEFNDYEYKIRIHEVGEGTVTLLFEEKGGRDGFAVSVKEDDLRSMLDDGTFDDWAKARVKERIKLLAADQQRKQEREARKQKLKTLDELLRKRKVRP